MQRNSIISLFIEAIIFIAIIMFGYNYFTNQIDTYDQNIKVYKNHMEQLELKNGELLTIRDSYILKTKELEEVLNISQKEVKELQKQLDSKVAYIAKLESAINTGPVIIQKDSIIYISKDEIETYFKYEDSWLFINGVTKIKNKTSQTTIDNISLNVPLTVGLSNDYKIFVSTPNPYISLSNIEGAVIDNSVLKPKKKRFNWGFQFGFGVSYDIIKQDYSIGPYTGIGGEINF